jgi:hypothetical protein
MKKSMKKSLINTAVLAIVLLLAASYYFYNFLPHEKKQEISGRAQLFPGFVKEDVSGLSIISSGPSNSCRMEFAQMSNSFFMTLPPTGKAKKL